MLDDCLETLEELGIDVYGGLEPPELAGTYFNDNQFTIYEAGEWSDGPSDRWWYNHHYRFFETDDPVTTLRASVSEFDNEGLDDLPDDSDEATKYYLSGSGDCFTRYRGADGRSEFEGCEYETIGVTTGCVTEDGIVNRFDIAFYENYEGDFDHADDPGGIPPEDSIRAAQAGVVERVDE